MARKAAAIHILRSRGSGKRGHWRFRVVGRNGEIMAQSEGYISELHARRGARALIRVLSQPTIHVI